MEQSTENYLQLHSKQYKKSLLLPFMDGGLLIIIISVVKEVTLPSSICCVNEFTVFVSSSDSFILPSKV